MLSISGLFAGSDEKPEEKLDESQKLLDLYWKRAELKKEFDGLRDEQYRLQDRIKEHESESARHQQQLEYLENLLLDPESVYDIVTHFQLRGLDLRCRAKLAKFAEQLKQQREHRQHSQVIDEWNVLRGEEAADVERQIGEQGIEIQMLEDHLQAERHKLATMSGFLKIFRRRSVTATLDNIAENIELAQENEQALLLRLDEIENRQPPDTEGLDIQTKRLINFMILSFAQQLYLHYREDELADLAKDAGEKSVGTMKFGDKDECDEIIERIKQRIDSFDNGSDFADALQRCAKMIGETAKFRSDDDAVPDSASVSTIYSIDCNGIINETELNLLGENYWNLNSVVSR